MAAGLCAASNGAGKQHMSTLEMSHPLGGFGDIDILIATVSRYHAVNPGILPAMFDMPAGGFISCARGKHHTLDLLLDEIARSD